MEELFKQHYQAIVDRGLINKNTPHFKFIEKIDEEINELANSLSDDFFNNAFNEIITLSDESKQEAIDLICVVANMLRFYGIDIESELKKNVEVQQQRALKSE